MARVLGNIHPNWRQERPSLPSVCSGTAPSPFKSVLQQFVLPKTQPELSAGSCNTSAPPHPGHCSPQCLPLHPAADTDRRFHCLCQVQATLLFPVGLKGRGRRCRSSASLEKRKRLTAVFQRLEASDGLGVLIAIEISLRNRCSATSLLASKCLAQWCWGTPGIPRDQPEETPAHIRADPRDPLGLSRPPGTDCSLAGARPALPPRTGENPQPGHAQI